MSNLIDNNYRTLRLRCDKSYYWDFFICKDRCVQYSTNFPVEGLSAMIDWSIDECVDGNWALSLSGYSWENSVSNGVDMTNIGYTGVDNGLILYRRDRILNKDFVDIFQNSEFHIEEGDTRLKLHAVSGTTMQYDYPLSVKDGVAVFNGGFYQGFFKTTCDEYYILPSVLEYGDEWNFEFVLNKCEMEPESNKTLNDKYPENKGIFFYMGTRAENKWVYLYNKVEDGDECEELGPGDYVEDGDIDRNTYIIDNFLDVDPGDVEWTEEDEKLWFINDKYEYSDENDKYTDFMFCPWSSYTEVLDELDDYLDIEPETKPENVSSGCVEIGKCEPPCNSGGGGCENAPAYKYIKVPFATCGCGRSFRRVKVEAGCNEKTSEFGVTPGEMFGDDYISGFDGVDCEFNYVEPEMSISDFDYSTDNGFELDEKDQYYFYTDNKFILFDRTKDGYNVSNYTEGDKMMLYGTRSRFNGNLFILMNRTKTGFTVSNIREYMKEQSDAEGYDVYSDIYDNALAFRIDDNGAIGYRLLTADCEISGDNKVSIVSGSSEDGVIDDCSWHHVNIRMIGFTKTMKLMFYVDGKLVFISKEVPKVNFRELSEIMDKQEGVPYNISIGGGTQGLAETIVDNYMSNPYRVYPLEKYFAGSFIGYMKSFNFYARQFDYGIIRNNFKHMMRELSSNTYLY